MERVVFAKPGAAACQAWIPAAGSRPLGRRRCAFVSRPQALASSRDDVEPVHPPEPAAARPAGVSFSRRGALGALLAVVPVLAARTANAREIESTDISSGSGAPPSRNTEAELGKEAQAGVVGVLAPLSLLSDTPPDSLPPFNAESLPPPYNPEALPDSLPPFAADTLPEAPPLLGAEPQPDAVAPGEPLAFQPDVTTPANPLASLPDGGVAAQPPLPPAGEPAELAAPPAAGPPAEPLGTDAAPAEAEGAPLAFLEPEAEVQAPLAQPDVQAAAPLGRGPDLQPLTLPLPDWQPGVKLLAGGCIVAASIAAAAAFGAREAKTGGGPRGAALARRLSRTNKDAARMAFFVNEVQGPLAQLRTALERPTADPAARDAAMRLQRLCDHRLASLAVAADALETNPTAAWAAADAYYDALLPATRQLDNPRFGRDYDFSAPEPAARSFALERMGLLPEQQRERAQQLQQQPQQPRYGGPAQPQDAPAQREERAPAPPRRLMLSRPTPRLTRASKAATATAATR